VKEDEKEEVAEEEEKEDRDAPIEKNGNNILLYF